VCAAKFVLRSSSRAAVDGPVVGKKVSLVELGSHCRGAMFLDGGWVVTPALEARFGRDCEDLRRLSTSAASTCASTAASRRFAKAALQDRRAERRHVRSDAHLPPWHAVARGLTVCWMSSGGSRSRSAREPPPRCRDDAASSADRNGAGVRANVPRTPGDSRGADAGLKPCATLPKHAAQKRPPGHLTTRRRPWPSGSRVKAPARKPAVSGVVSTAPGETRAMR